MEKVCNVLAAGIVGILLWGITLFLFTADFPYIGVASLSIMAIFFSPIIFFAIPHFIKKVDREADLAIWFLAIAPLFWCIQLWISFKNK